MIKAKVGFIVYRGHNYGHLNPIQTTILTICKQVAITCFFIFYALAAIAQTQNATVKEYKQTFTTYPYSDPNPIPTLSSLYPYFRYDGFTNKSIQKAWKIVELENDFIKVLITPELGGKIWTAIEKSTNQPFIYYNHVVKFRDIALRGPYTSGGLELNYGIIGHTPNCNTPVDYITQTNADGSVSCIVGVLDLLTRTNWRLEIRLEKDKAYFITRSFWYNSTPIGQPYYHWLNGGYKAEGNLEFIFPGTHYIGHDGEKFDWPINKTNGKNISFYESNNFGGYKSYHVLGKYTNFFGGYWHNDDFGIARYGARNDKAGKKIWIWGLSRQGMIWDKLLTDNDGQYVEMQSGRLFNQNSPISTRTPFKHISFAPYSTDVWTEYFYPVMRTKGFVEANEYGALNVKNSNGYLKLYFSPAQNINDIIEVTENNKVIYSHKLQLSPLKTFADSIKYQSNGENLTVTIGGNKLVYNSNPEATVLSRPTDAPNSFNWNSAYGLNILGKDAMDQKMYPLAEEKLKASLKADSNYLPTLVKLAELHYRNMLYTKALETTKKALSIDTQDGAANYYYGLANIALNNIVDAKDGFEIATLSSEYRSAAYTQLSKIYLKERSFEKALGYTERALDYNRFNIEALQLQAVIYRSMSNLNKATEALTTILSFDALNHFARFEQYLINPDEANKTHFTSLIRNELQSETYIELAIWYYSAGCLNEAEKVFSFSPQTPEVNYWLCFFQNKKVNCDDINPTYSFPFRSETGFVLEQLLTQQNDWLLKYQLALIYNDRNRVEESIKLLISCGNSPNFAPFYAFRANILERQNDSIYESDLKKALSLDNHWRYQQLLAKYYIRHKHFDKAVAITEAFYRSNANNLSMSLLHAKNLMLNKKYKEADELLTKFDVVPNEGATEGRELYREAKLMQAVQLIHKKNYSTALKFINQAKLWPENLGAGKPYDEDIDLRLEEWMSYLCNKQLNKAKEADELLNKIVKFQPSIENGFRNYQSANALITAWAFEKLNRRDDASKWLDLQILNFPKDDILVWVKSVFEKLPSIDIPEKVWDENIRIIEALSLQVIK